MKQKFANKMTVKTAQLDNQIAAFLVPDYNDGQKLAIVDEGVLEYLKSLLSTARTRDIIMAFRMKLEKAGEENDLKMAVEMAQQFVAFHKSVNLLDDYFDVSISKHIEEPFNVTRELTITEMIDKLNQMTEELAKYKTEVENHPDYPKPEVVKSPR